jgi:transposase/IS5 family transposase
MLALPPTFEELIPSDHPVRIVNHIIDDINLDPLMKKYKALGCSSYHPRLMMKILVYGYLCNIYSSRKIESAVKENIFFMWLAGMEQPDHNTINRFRTNRLKDVIKKIFSEIVLLMSESGHVDLQKAYTDGTKIEANANRYTFVWGKRIKTNRERISKQLDELWAYTQEIAAEELKDTTPVGYDKTDPEEVRKTVEQIDRALQDKPVEKKIKQKISYAKKNWPDKLQEYIEQEDIMQNRNSYSKTDHDATFMRMKEDHMKNGQLKPAYNTQISTSNQIITNYSIHQNPTDTRTLKPHLEQYKHQYGFMPKELTTDAGYGSEENYDYLEQEKIEAYVKYNYFDKEQREKEKAKSPFHVDNLYYNKELDCYYCPMGQQMKCIGTTIEETETGYKKVLSRYQAQSCTACPIRGMCHQAKDNRIIEISHRLNELKTKARELLLSEKGIAHRSQRPVDVEPVFGMIKYNRGFKRFMLRGLEKVNIEFGLVAIAHNLKKLTAYLNQNPFKFIQNILKKNYSFVLE